MNQPMLVMGPQVLHGRGIHPYSEEIPTVEVWVISTPVILYDSPAWAMHEIVDARRDKDLNVIGYHPYYLLFDV